MALNPLAEKLVNGTAQDLDGRTIVVGPDGVPIAGGGGGGGTQYTEGVSAPDATPTGNVIIWKSVGDAMVAVSAANPLPVNVSNIPHVVVDSMPAGGSGLTDTELRATPVPVVTQEPISVDDNGGSLTVDGSVAVSNFPATQPVSGSVTADTELPAAAALSDTTANPTTPMVGAGMMLWDGTQWQRARTIDVVNGFSVFPDGLLTNIPVIYDPNTGLCTALRGISSDAVANGLNLAVSPSMYNGATWDRMRGDTTNGLDVDVTRVQGNVAVTGTFWQATQPVSGTVTADTELPAAAALSDATANPTTPMVGAGGMLWDSTGSQWTRARSYPVTDGVAAITAVPSGMLVSTSANTMNRIWSENQIADTDTAPHILPTASHWYNGSSYDRARGDVANGLDVDVTRIQGSDVDHDAVNTLKNIQIAGNASPVDNPPTAVSAAGDRARIWVDRFGAQVVRRRKIRESYTAVFRLAEAAARLDQTFTHTANTNKQWATIHHTAAATKELQLMKVFVWITGDTTAAQQGIIELRELSSATPPATGNPAITPRARRIGTGAAEATCLYLPTTQGSEAAANSPISHIPLDLGIMGAVSTVNPVPGPDMGPGGLVLYDSSREDDQVMSPTAPVGVYGGWAVVTRYVPAAVIRMTVQMVFTEEIP